MCPPRRLWLLTPIAQIVFPEAGIPFAVPSGLPVPQAFKRGVSAS